MNIINITPGILPIPPKNWGAIEKAIWNYHINFEKIGIPSSIKYLDEINNDGYSIIHSHVTNLSNMANDRGLEYFFSMHDHHVMFDYPDITYLEETRKAIKNSIKTIVHTPQLLVHKNFKDLAHKMIYVQHGADPEIYKNYSLDRPGDLLCVGSNGFLNHKNFDRKGFILAKQCAEYLNLKLTICSPSHNKEFFDHFRFFESPNITIKFDLNEQELIQQYNTHKIFLHPSILEAGDPNLTLTEAHFCGIKIVGSYHGEIPIEGMFVVNDLTPTSYVNAIRIALSSNYPFNTNESFTWETVSKKLIGIYKKYGHTKKKFLDTLLFSYSDNKSSTHGINEEPRISVKFDMVPTVELKTIDDKSHTVKFCSVNDDGTTNIIYQTDLSNNMWARPNDVYAKHWAIYLDDSLKYEKNIDLQSDICAVVSSYPNSEDVKNKTINTITNLKKRLNNIPIIYATHLEYKNDPNEIPNTCDHYVFDPNNTLTTHNYYRFYRGNADGYQIFLDLLNSGNATYHGPAVQQNYYNGVELANKLGYKYAILTNFDMLFSEQDINKIRCILNTIVINNSDGFFLYTNEPEGPTYKTVFCIVNTNMFLKAFPKINNENDYNKFVYSIGSESNGLENIYYHALKNIDNLTIKESSESEFFNNTDCFTNSQADYLSILPIKDREDMFGIFIRKPNKNVTEYNLELYVTEFINSESKVVYKENFQINSEFEKVVPVKLNKNNKYEISIIDTFNEKKLQINDFEVISTYGHLIPMQ